MIRHKQVDSISEMQFSNNSEKIIGVIHHINRAKQKKHVIVLTNPGNARTKIQFQA